MTDYYLPDRLYGRVESILARPDISMPGPIESPAAPKLDWIFQIFASTANAAINHSWERHSLRQTIYYCVVDTDAMNAVAMRLGVDEYCIAISAELIVRTWLLGGYFELCSAMKNAFPKDEEPPLITPENYRSLTHTSPLPKEFEKEATFRSRSGLGRAAAMALVFHELGHIINGHNGLASLTAMAEVSPGLIERDQLRRRRTLEYDADAFAALEMVRFFHNTPRLIAEHLCSTKNDHLRFAVAATLTCFAVFTAGQPYDPNWAATNTTHPAAFDRFRGATSTFFSIIGRDNPDIDYDTISKEIIAPVHEAVFGCLFQVCQYNLEGQDIDAVMEAYNRYSEDVWACWAELRPLLVKTKLGTHNLAPVHERYAGQEDVTP